MPGGSRRGAREGRSTRPPRSPLHAPGTSWPATKESFSRSLYLSVFLISIRALCASSTNISSLPSPSNLYFRNHHPLLHLLVFELRRYSTLALLDSPQQQNRFVQLLTNYLRGIVNDSSPKSGNFQDVCQPKTEQHVMLNFSTLFPLLNFNELKFQSIDNGLCLKAQTSLRIHIAPINL